MGHSASQGRPKPDIPVGSQVGSQVGRLELAHQPQVAGNVQAYGSPGAVSAEPRQQGARGFSVFAVLFAEGSFEVFLLGRNHRGTENNGPDNPEN